jgi:hypothetical protein
VLQIITITPQLEGFLDLLAEACDASSQVEAHGWAASLQQALLP